MQVDFPVDSARRLDGKHKYLDARPLLLGSILGARAGLAQFGGGRPWRQRGLRRQRGKCRIRARKSRTSYFNPLTPNLFDAVINPVIIEPVVPFTSSIKAKYEPSRK